jgi:hypothetical protein
MERSPFVKLIVAQLVKGFNTFYGKSIIIFTRTHHLLGPEAVESNSTTYILILPFYLRVDFSGALIPSGFATKILYAFLISAEEDSSFVRTQDDLVSNEVVAA